MHALTWIPRLFESRLRSTSKQPACASERAFCRGQSCLSLCVTRCGVGRAVEGSDGGDGDACLAQGIPAATRRLPRPLLRATPCAGQLSQPHCWRATLHTLPAKNGRHYSFAVVLTFRREISMCLGPGLFLQLGALTCVRAAGCGRGPAAHHGVRQDAEPALPHALGVRVPHAGQSHASPPLSASAFVKHGVGLVQACLRSVCVLMLIDPHMAEN